MTSPQRPFEVIPIPRNIESPTDLDGIIQRYKFLRLHGLEVDPQSFTTRYEDEVKFPYETWVGRMMNPVARTFAAVESLNAQPDSPTQTREIEGDQSDDIQSLLAVQWSGIVTLIGPIAFPQESDHTTTPSASMKLHTAFMKDGKYQMPSLPTKDEDLKDAHAVYLVVGMFVSPQARRRGVGRRLIEASIDYIRDAAQRVGASRASIAIQFCPNNTAAQGLYERSGFTLSEKRIVLDSKNGDGEEETVVGMEMKVV